MSANMNWVVRISLALLLAYFLLGTIESRTSVFSSFFSALSGVNLENSQAQKILKEDLRFATSVQKKYVTDITRQSREISKLASQIRTLEKEKELLAITNNSLTEKAKNLMLPETFFDKPVADLSNYLLRPAILIVSGTNQSKQQTCAVEARQSLYAWLKFIDLYNSLSSNSLKSLHDSFDQLSMSKLEQFMDISKDQYFWIAPLVRNLLRHHSILTAHPDWEARLNTIYHDQGSDDLIDKLYSAGYSKSTDPCLMSEDQVTIESLGGSFTTKVLVERWFYTFWLRRYAEGTMETAHLGLELIALSIAELETDSDKRHNYVFFAPEPSTSNLLEENQTLLALAKQMLISRESDEKAVFWVGSENKLPAHREVYAFAGQHHGKRLNFLETRKFVTNDAVKFDIGHIYENIDIKIQTTGLFTTGNSRALKNDYRRIKTTAAARSKLAEFLTSIYGAAWVIDNMREGTDIRRTRAPQSTC